MQTTTTLCVYISKYSLHRLPFDLVVVVVGALNEKPIITMIGGELLSTVHP